MSVKSKDFSKIRKAMEVSVINGCEMEEIQELGTRTKQRIHVSIFGLEGFLEIAKTKSRHISSKGRGAHFPSPKQKRLKGLH